MPPSLKLEKVRPEFVAAQRGKWQTVKAKHASAIKAKKINFNKNLGGLLDKRKAPIATIQS